MSKAKSVQGAKFEKFGADPLRPWLLAGAAALYVARPLLPSESAAISGDGLPLVMFWFWLALAWLLWGAARGKLSLRLHWTDAALLVFAVCYALACYQGAKNNAGRPCLNMLWEGLALMLGYFLLRQWIATAHECRALVAVMIALAVVESGYGLFQYTVSMPADRAYYKEDPDAALRSHGLWYPPNSPERKRYEDRLASTEPFATFQLANSLAGMLAPWFVTVLGVALTALAIRANDRQKSADETKSKPPQYESSLFPPQFVLLSLFCAMPMVLVLILTKSRSAWIACAWGIAALGMLNWRSFRTRWMKGALVGAAIFLGILVVGLSVLGALDREVITEAGKSLGYRGQYWRATWGMICDHFWLGCGPGNFQDYYTQYKLPEASEVIGDPHNFLFEIWATAGTPAMLAFMVLLAGIGWKVWLARNNSLEQIETDRLKQQQSPAQSGSLLIFLIAAEAGLLLAFVISVYFPLGVTLKISSLAGGILMFSAAILFMSPWVNGGRLPNLLPAIAAIVLLINLLAAGGLLFPGVAGSLWLLLAVTMSQASLGAPSRVFTRMPSMGFAAVAGILTAFCYATSYEPVIKCRQELQIARASEGAAQKDPGGYEAHLVAAAQADPWSIEPRGLLASQQYFLWERRFTGDALTDFERATQQLIEAEPKSSAIWRQKGDWYWTIALRLRDAPSARSKAERLFKTTLEAYQRAAELYPNHALTRAKIARSLQEAGDSAQAAREAAEALRLDEINPHSDQKLPDTMRELMQKFVVEKRKPS